MTSSSYPNCSLLKAHIAFSISMYRISISGEVYFSFDIFFMILGIYDYSVTWKGMHADAAFLAALS